MSDLLVAVHHGDMDHVHWKAKEMSICDVYENWGEEPTLDARLDGLAELLNEVIADWGYGQVAVTYEAPPAPDEEAVAVYRADEERIYLNPAYFETVEEPDEAMNVAVHEAFHAMHDQAGTDLSNWDEEFEAASAAAAEVADRLEVCVSEEEPESGAASDLPDYGWSVEP